MDKKTDVGYIQKAHGLKGEVLLKPFDGESSYLSKGLELFLGDKAYKLLSFRLVTGGVILRLAEVDDRNSSDLLKGKTVSVDSELFSKLSGDGGLYLNQLLGFSVFLRGEKKGEVSGFAETEAHDLLKVETSGGEIELPYVESFISEIKDLHKEIHVDCPAEIFDADFFSGGAKK